MTCLKAGEQEDEDVWLQDPVVSPPAQVQPQRNVPGAFTAWSKTFIEDAERHLTFSYLMPAVPYLLYQITKTMRCFTKPVLTFPEDIL